MPLITLQYMESAFDQIQPPLTASYELMFGHTRRHASTKGFVRLHAQCSHSALRCMMPILGCTFQSIESNNSESIHIHPQPIGRCIQNHMHIFKNVGSQSSTILYIVCCYPIQKAADMQNK